MSCPSCGHDPEIGEWPLDCKGAGHELGVFWRGAAAIHSSEKVVIFENAKTGEVRIPGRGDRPINPKLAQCGFERRELSTMNEVRWREKKTGTASEALNYDRSGRVERDTKSI